MTPKPIFQGDFLMSNAVGVSIVITGGLWLIYMIVKAIRES